MLTEFGATTDTSVLGEVESYARFDGEPLVFHSGYYRVATRHPEFPEG